MQQLTFSGNPNLPNILFMAEISGDCVAVSTLCRKHNRRGRFLIIRERLRELLDDDPRDYISKHTKRTICFFNTHKMIFLQ